MTSPLQTITYNEGSLEMKSRIKSAFFCLLISQNVSVASATTFGGDSWVTYAIVCFALIVISVCIRLCYWCLYTSRIERPTAGLRTVISSEPDGTQQRYPPYSVNPLASSWPPSHQQLPSNSNSHHSNSFQQISSAYGTNSSTSQSGEDLPPPYEFLYPQTTTIIIADTPPITPIETPITVKNS